VEPRSDKGKELIVDKMGASLERLRLWCVGPYKYTIGQCYGTCTHFLRGNISNKSKPLIFCIFKLISQLINQFRKRKKILLNPQITGTEAVVK
jgi:hypothetical protein